MSVSTCLPLAGSTMCPDFVSLNAFITSNLAFITDVAAFDNYIRQSIDTSTAANTFGDQVRTNPVFNCPNWDGTGLRYLQSSLCAYLVGQGVNQAADATPDTPCNPPGTVVPLCASSMTKFGASWNTVFSSRTFCPAGAGSLGAGPSSLVNFILGTQVTLSNEATCIAAEAGEKSNCGFTSAADARKFCATATVAAEPCCSAFPAAAAATSAVANIPTVAAPKLATAVATTAAPSSEQQSSGGGMSVGVIAGAGGGALLLIIGVVVFFCMRRKKQGSATNKSKGMNNNNYDMEDRQQFSNKGAPMGFAPPPVPQSGPQDMYEAIYDYTPNMSDELATMVGDKIILKCEYDDGWAFGFNTRTKKEGTFPLDILDKYSDPNAQFNDANRNQRASSMYGPAPGGFNNTNNNNNGESIYGAPTNTDSMYYAQSEYGNNTDSMYYGNNTDSVYAPGGGQTESMYVDNNQAADVHIAVYDFSPQMPDEIELRVGDKVQLKHQYDDGWAQGTNLSNGNKTGLFPLDCLEGFDAPQQQDANGKKQHNNRVSSMYGGGQDSVYYGNGTDSMYYPQSEYGTDSVYQANTDSVYYGTNNNNADSVYYGNGKR